MRRIGIQEHLSIQQEKFHLLIGAKEYRTTKADPCGPRTDAFE